MFYSAAPELSPGGLAMVSPCEPSKYYLLIHYNLLAVLDSCPLELKAMFWQPISQAEVLKAGASDAEFKSSPQEEAQSCEFLSGCVLPYQGWSLGRHCVVSPPLLPVSMWGVSPCLCLICIEVTDMC